LNLGHQVEAHLYRRYCRHLGMKHMAACNHISFHARLRAKNARHMRGLCTHD
jgi:hypothetical protein